MPESLTNTVQNSPAKLGNGVARVPITLAIHPSLLPLYNAIKTGFNISDDQLANEAVNFVIFLYQQGLTGRAGSFQEALVHHKVMMQNLHQRINAAVSQSAQTVHNNRAILKRLESFVTKPEIPSKS